MAQESGISCCSYYNDNKNKNKKKIPSEKHTWKTKHQGTKENNRTGPCARTSKSTNVKAQNFYHEEEHHMYLTCTMYCKYRIAVTLCTVETRFLPGT